MGDARRVVVEREREGEREGDNGRREKSFRKRERETDRQTYRNLTFRILLTHPKSLHFRLFV